MGAISHCVQCGKVFYCPDEEKWAYRTRYVRGHELLVCSWHCLRAYEKDHPYKRGQKYLNHIGARKKAYEL